MLPWMTDLWLWLVAILSLTAMVTASGHAMIYKRDPRASIAWVGLIWLAPLIGAALYVLVGVNRIRRRAVALRGAAPAPAGAPAVAGTPAVALRGAAPVPAEAPALAGTLAAAGTPAAADAPAATGTPPAADAPAVAGACETPIAASEVAAAPVVSSAPVPTPHLEPLARLIDRLARRPLVPGNRIVPFVDGDEAYPRMLEAIDAARASVVLSTYIFDHDPAGLRFVEALARASARGVAVRVLIDAVGARYSRISTAARLERRGVPVALFLPARLPWRLPYFNLRNHRKILVADGRVGFTGGMNLRAGHVLQDAPRDPVRDFHFLLEGPVVAHLQQAFAEDWGFTTGERLAGERWFPALGPQGDAIARGILDGPDEDFDVLRLTRLGALSCARESVWLMTPYFVPDPALLQALNVAALRGVRVRILLPGTNNLPLVHWASRSLWWQVLERGCELRLSPPPFDHSKLLLLDRAWSLFGGCNWDARSLRLNFELDVECHDAALAARLEAIVSARWEKARPVTSAEVDGRSLPGKLRDGAARLLAPFL